MKPYKQLSSKVMIENPWWRYCLDQIELPSGRPGEYHYVLTNGSSISDDQAIATASPQPGTGMSADEFLVALATVEGADIPAADVPAAGVSYSGPIKIASRRRGGAAKGGVAGHSHEPQRILWSRGGTGVFVDVVSKIKIHYLLKNSFFYFPG